MEKYIEADKLKKHYSWWAVGSEEYREFKQIFDDIIDAQPPQDVVKVVRCRNCKWRTSFCNNYGKRMDDDGFCSYGEREKR